MEYRLKNIINWYSKNRDKISKRYDIVKIPKRNGTLRTLEVPSFLIKTCQQTIKKYLSDVGDCSSFAAAYQKGCSVKNVANSHIGNKLLLKLDIKDFFGHITADLVKNKVFDCEDGDVLTEICCCEGHLPQGACTSPIISNIVMRDFDNELGLFCMEHNIRFNRYSDDMIFSGDFNPGMVIRKVRELLHEMNMEINKEKTVIAGKGSRQMVLGVVVNEKVQLSSDYRRKIRQEVYYCSKYGVVNHILKSNVEKFIFRDAENNVLSVNAIGYMRALIGRINYALYVNPDDLKMKEAEKTIHELWVWYKKEKEQMQNKRL